MTDRAPKTSRPSWLAAGLVALALATDLRGDTIELTNGKKIEGVDVIQGRWDAVQYKQGNRPPVSLPVNQVRALVRQDPILERAMQHVDGGEYQKAIDVGKVAPAGKAWIPAEILYRVGVAQARAGQYAEAEKTFKEYTDKYKAEKDWYVPQATLALADALLAAKKPGTAATQYKDLASFGGQWELYSKLGQAEAIVGEKGKAGALDARRLFDEVSRTRSAPIDLRQKALVGRARVFLLQDQPDQALKELSDGFFDNPRPEELVYSAERAEASILMAKAYIAKGGKENLEQAELWLLRVPALYGKHAAQYSEACGLLADLYSKLSNPARGAEWKARASGGGGAGGK